MNIDFNKDDKGVCFIRISLRESLIRLEILLTFMTNGHVDIWDLHENIVEATEEFYFRSVYNRIKIATAKSSSSIASTYQFLIIPNIPRLA